MRKILMTSYNIKVKDQNSEIREIPYEVRESMVSILFQPSLRLSALTLLKQNSLAEKVAQSGDELLLEEEEYQRVRKAVEVIEGLGQNDVEFVKRIMDAVEIEVSAK